MTQIEEPSISVLPDEARQRRSSAIADGPSTASRITKGSSGWRNAVRTLSGVAMTASVLTGAATEQASASPPISSPQMQVVASGLNSPKHITFGPGGLYITESGTGGPSGPACVAAIGVTGAPTTFCEGPTASVAVLGHFGLRTVLSGLPSFTEEDTQETLGPSALAFVPGNRFTPGGLGVLLQDGLVKADGTTSLPGPAASAFGKLLFEPSGRVLADVAAFTAANPQSAATLGGVGETTYDSDPYDVVPYRGGLAIADAAANTIEWLSPRGDLSRIAQLPTTPEAVPAGALGPGSPAMTVDAQAVPTSLAVGRDGALYVGLLRGVPSLPGTADVFRVVPGQAPVAVVTGLTAVTDISFDPRGRLLVLEYNTGGLLAPSTTPGALVRINLDRGQPVAAPAPLPVNGLFSPTGLAVSRDGAVYISNYGTSPGTATPSGEIVRVAGLG